MSYLRRIGHTDAVSERRGERSVVSSGVAGALNGLTQNTSCLQSMAMQQLDIIQETATRVFTMESAVQRILVTAEAHEHQLRAIVPPEKSSEPDSLSANRQQQFQHHLRTLKEQNQKLQKDLDKKTRDNKNLHQMILESGSKRNDIFSDDQISQRLSHLNQAILRIVSRYFNVVEPAGKSGNRIPDTLRIRSEIADNLHRSFFAEDKSLFGLEPGFEEDQQELEQKLLDRGGRFFLNVPPALHQAL